MTLRETIKAKGIKQSWLAQQIGVSEVTVSHWVSNKSIPKPHHQLKLKKILGISKSTIHSIK